MCAPASRWAHFLFLWQFAAPALADNLCARGWHAKGSSRRLSSVSGCCTVQVRRHPRPPMADDRAGRGCAVRAGHTTSCRAEWRGTWQDEKNASELLAAEAVNRGVSWSLPQPYSYGRASLELLPFAAKLFVERRRMLGDEHPYLKQWLENQRAVFAKSSPDLVECVGAAYRSRCSAGGQTITNTSWRRSSSTGESLHRCG